VNKEFIATYYFLSPTVILQVVRSPDPRRLAPISCLGAGVTTCHMPHAGHHGPFGVDFGVRERHDHMPSAMGAGGASLAISAMGAGMTTCWPPWGADLRDGPGMSTGHVGRISFDFGDGG
jgi:hypothetical protein